MNKWKDRVIIFQDEYDCGRSRCGPAKFNKLLIKHPSTDIKDAAAYLSLKFKEVL